MNKYKIVYCTPSLYIPGGVERVLTTKTNYFADVLGYDIYIILTDGKNKKPYYPLSNNIHIIQLDINFEELWHLSFLKKTYAYLCKEKKYKRLLTEKLLNICPDITVSLLRREINFINDIHDGSKKIGEIHVNRHNYRNFEKSDTNIIKKIFSFFWQISLVSKIKKLDKFIVLTNEDKLNWKEITNIQVIPNPISFIPKEKSTLKNKKVIAVGRYSYQKGFDLLLKSWSIVNKIHPDWILNIYGSGDRKDYIQLAKDLNIQKNCNINEAVPNITEKYLESSIFVLSSRFEGFGMVIIEAMACGVPSISFNCPCGPKDIIRDGINGYLVETNDINNLANKICELIEDEKLKARMGKECVTDINRYCIEEISKEWTSLFYNIIGK